MERVCMNCKYYYCGKCYNKHLGLKVDTRRGFEFVESGEMTLALQEGLNLKKLTRMIADQMKKDKIISLRPDTSKINTEELEPYIIEYLESVLYKPLDSYFDGVNYGICIDDPREFGCNHWD